TVSSSCARSRARFANSRRFAMTVGSATRRSSSSYRRSISASRSNIAQLAPARGRRTVTSGLRGAAALEAVLALEPLDASGGVDQLLLPGEEGVTRRADLDVDGRDGRPGLDGIAAGTDDLRLVVPRMNPFLYGRRHPHTGAPAAQRRGRSR